MQSLEVTEKNFPQGEDDESDELDGLHHHRQCVRLKNGIPYSDLKKKDGFNFELDEEDLVQNDENDDYCFDQESLRYAKYELLGESGNDEEEEDENKPYMTPFEQMVSKMVDITSEANGGVLKRIVKAGVGSVPPPKSKVFVHYNGYLEYTPEPFDSTYLRSHTFKFNLDSGFVIEGLNKGIASMRKGEKSYFLIQPEYAFGPMGCPPRIPPSAVVLFEVELFDFCDDYVVTEYENMTPAEQVQASFAKLYEVSSVDYQCGNDYFKQNMLERASVRYERAARLLESCILKDEEDQRRCEALQLKIYLNLALLKDRMGNTKQACRFAKRALGIDKHNTKALYRLGRCFIQSGDYEKAKEPLQKARQNEPTNPDIIKELINLDKKCKDYKRVERERCLKMFKNVASDGVNKQKLEKKMETLSVSEEFKSLVMEQLTFFKEDDGETEMSLPEGLNPNEQAYVAATAEVMNLGLRHETHAGCLRIKLYKH